MRRIWMGQFPEYCLRLRIQEPKPLNKIKVVVYFKDSSENIIAEEDYLPILVSEYSFNDDKPLKPGYVWSMEQNKFYAAKSVPTEWEEGSIDIAITEIDFAPEE